jgi:hypothetical protein
MAIPEAQLETWSGLGSVAQSRDTYATVRKALEDIAAPFAGRGFNAFLQGSYGNDTNIYADSDVDVVMLLNSAFYHDLTRLDDNGRARFHNAFPGAASYGLSEFKPDVTGWLIKKFGATVTPGEKAVFIPANGGRRNADVLPAANFRRYHKFNSTSDQSYVEGICFYLPDSTRIENFPKQHSENLTTKHQATTQWFKPTARIFKNMRNRMIEVGTLQEGVAPSYFIEGLLYNVPNTAFGTSYGATVAAVLNSVSSADRSKFVCANEQFYLLHDTSRVTWRAADCQQFINACIDLWNNW